jgi:hypothetical protein
MAPAPISLAAASPRSQLRDPTSTVTPFVTSSLGQTQKQLLTHSRT